MERLPVRCLSGFVIYTGYGVPFLRRAREA